MSRQPEGPKPKASQEAVLCQSLSPAEAPRVLQQQSPHASPWRRLLSSYLTSEGCHLLLEIPRENKIPSLQQQALSSPFSSALVLCLSCHNLHFNLAPSINTEHYYLLQLRARKAIRPGKHSTQGTRDEDGHALILCPFKLPHPCQTDIRV